LELGEVGGRDVAGEELELGREDAYRGALETNVAQGPVRILEGDGEEIAAARAQPHRRRAPAPVHYGRGGRGAARAAGEGLPLDAALVGADADHAVGPALDEVDVGAGDAEPRVAAQRMAPGRDLDVVEISCRSLRAVDHEVRHAGAHEESADASPRRIEL